MRSRGRRSLNVYFFPSECILNYRVLNWERTTTKKQKKKKKQKERKKMHIHRLCGGEGCVCRSVCQSGWGKITEERTAQEVLKFKILLASLGSLAREGLCVDLSEYLFQAIAVSGSCGQGSVPRTWNTDTEENAEAVWAAASWFWLQDGALETPPPPPPPQEPAFALCVFRFYFYFGTLWERVSEHFPFGLPLCSCKVLFLSWCCKLHFH